jgi:hypothetical protein
MANSNSPAKPGNSHAKRGNGSASSDRSRDRHGSAFAHSRPVLVIEDDEATREMLRYLVMSAFFAFNSVLFRQYVVWFIPFIPLTVLEARRASNHAGRILMRGQ